MPSRSSRPRPLAIVTGASSGIGCHLARCCAGDGFDLILVADQPLEAAAGACRALGATVETVHTELASRAGVNKVLERVKSRRVDALLANAGHGLGRTFLEQDFAEVQRVIDTHITGTIYLVQKVAREMVAARRGRVLITGSIAGFQPGAFEAVYNGTKAFIDSFAGVLRRELKDTGVTVSLLMPGPADTGLFSRADMLDTRVSAGKKAPMDPAEVAKIGFEAMMDGDADVVAGLKTSCRSA